MSPNKLRLLHYALRFPGGWEPYGKDRKTVRDLRELEQLGLIVRNQFRRQFRLAIAADSFNALHNALGDCPICADPLTKHHHRAS